VKALRDRGVALRASSGALAQLAATVGSRPAAAGKSSAATAEPPVRAGDPAKKLTEMFAETVKETRCPSLRTFAKENSGNAPPAMEPSSLAPKIGSKAERLAAMCEPVLACVKCPNLVSSRTQVVFGVGNPEAELMFVGEAPGADEDAAGEPFVGRQDNSSRRSSRPWGSSARTFTSPTS
jgi:DNA polymerase